MIHWDSLALVAVATLIATVVVVAVVSVGIVSLAKVAQAPSRSAALRLRLAGYACLVLAGAVVLFGIYLIVPQFG